MTYQIGKNYDKLNKIRSNSQLQRILFIRATQGFKNDLSWVKLNELGCYITISSRVASSRFENRCRWIGTVLDVTAREITCGFERANDLSPNLSFSLVFSSFFFSFSQSLFFHTSTNASRTYLSHSSPRQLHARPQRPKKHPIQKIRFHIRHLPLFFITRY